MESILGIDIAKAKFDVYLTRESDKRGRHQTFSNTPEGFAELLAWLVEKGVPKVHACLEATGTYGLRLATALHEAEHAVSVVNPACVKFHAASGLRRTKNDRADARSIAQFCREKNPPLWTPTPPHLLELQALVRRDEDLQHLIVQETNRLKEPPMTQSALRSVKRVLSHLRKEQKTLEKDLRQLIDSEPRLKEQYKLLLSIPGVGLVCARTFLAEVGDIHRFPSTRQLAAYAGLVARETQSGSSVHSPPRLSKVGRSRLRTLLYLPAMTATRCNPLVAALAERLRAKNKTGKQVIIPAMRKLLNLMFGVLKTGRPFDPNYHPDLDETPEPPEDTATPQELPSAEHPPADEPPTPVKDPAPIPSALPSSTSGLSFTQPPLPIPPRPTTNVFTPPSSHDPSSAILEPTGRNGGRLCRRATGQGITRRGSSSRCTGASGIPPDAPPPKPTGIGRETSHA